MKRIIVLIIWLILFYLLGIFIYQKTTGRQVDGRSVRARIDHVAISVQHKVQLFSSSFIAPWTRTETGTQDITTKKNMQTGASYTGQAAIGITGNRNIKISWSGDSLTGDTKAGEQGGTQTFNFVKTGLVWNEDFASKLINTSSALRGSIGRGDLYAVWSGSVDGTNDKILISIGDTNHTYPAAYNSENVVNPNNVFQATGITIMNKDNYYLYYAAYNKGAMLKGFIMNAKDGSTISMDYLVPVLFYRDEYFFSILSGNTYQGLYKLQSGGISLLSLAPFKILSIENNYVAIQNTHSNTIEIYSIQEDQASYKIPLHRDSASFQSFLMLSGTIWLKYRDNQKNVIVYEQHTQQNLTN